MIADGPFFSHQNPEGDWPTQRARSAGIPFAGLGENIAAGQPTPADVFSAWLASDEHRANLENPAWTYQGVGYAYTSGGTLNHYWTHNFRHD
jgi:uncharacterized protein YkwD